MNHISADKRIDGNVVITIPKSAVHDLYCALADGVVSCDAVAGQTGIDIESREMVTASSRTLEGLMELLGNLIDTPPPSGRLKLVVK